MPLKRKIYRKRNSVNCLSYGIDQAGMIKTTTRIEMINMFIFSGFDRPNLHRLICNRYKNTIINHIAAGLLRFEGFTAALLMIAVFSACYHNNIIESPQSLGLSFFKIRKYWYFSFLTAHYREA